jgi:plastocyanin
MNMVRSSKWIAVATLALFAWGMTACASSKKQKKMEQEKKEKKMKKKKKAEPVEKDAIFANGRFNPGELTVPKGSTINFMNKGSSPIAVKITALDFDKRVATGESTSHTFQTTGEFLVENRLADNPQKMTIVVK